MRSIPDIAVSFIAKYEGMKLTSYPDPATGGDPWTVGYGSTGPHVTPGMTITKAKALGLLRDDVGHAVRKLYSVLTPAAIDSLDEAQWAALISFAFNLGAKKTWSIWKHINTGKLDLVPGEIMRFTRANGKVMKGLVNRRSAEVALWNTARPEEEDLPSSVTRQPGVTPPVTDMKPVAQSKTFWTGATVAAGGMVTGAQQLQALVAPQAHNSDLIAKVAGFAAVLVVAGGVLVMVLRWLDARARR